MLIAIEGGDGAGKATVSAALAGRIQADGRTACVISIPRYEHTVGGWALGEFLGGRIPREVTPRTAAVLYALDRMESRDMLLEAAATHNVVVLDRYIASNLAYQAAKVHPAEADELMRWIWELETTQFRLPPPDLSVYLATPVDIAQRQIAMKRKRSYTDDTFDVHEADLRLQERVADNYASLAAGNYAGRWMQVATATDGVMRSPGAIVDEIVGSVSS